MIHYNTLTTTSQGATAGNVSLLTCQSNRFVDNSTNAFTITPNGTPSVQAYSPYSPASVWSSSSNGGSGYFNGSTDIIRATVGTAPGTLFTIEGWCYLTAFNTGSPNIFSIVGSGSSNGFQVFASATVWGVRTNTSNVINYTAVPAKLNTWYHVAFTRSSNTISCYLNGTLTGTSSWANNSTNSSTASYILQAVSASYATTASYASNSTIQ